jgi:hypothetical protein
MRTLVDDRLRGEARLYDYRFACEDCAHAAGTPGEPQHHGLIACSLGFPAAPRRSALADSHMTLCKAFELR